MQNSCTTLDEMYSSVSHELLIKNVFLAMLVPSPLQNLFLPYYVVCGSNAKEYVTADPEPFASAIIMYDQSINSQNKLFSNNKDELKSQQQGFLYIWDQQLPNFGINQIKLLLIT